MNERRAERGNRTTITLRNPNKVRSKNKVEEDYNILLFVGIGTD